MWDQSNCKIYSRKRLKFNKLPYFDFRFKKIFIFLIIMCIGLFIYNAIWKSINPIFIELCRDEAKAIATTVTNEETTKIMAEYDYDTFFTIEKDEDGNIQMISANILKINQITSDIALNIQTSLENNENSRIYISTGSATGVKILAGIGPKIPVSISTTGNVETNIKSEFVSQGVNQTLHRVYMEIESNIIILMPSSTIEENISNQVLILENVIVGEIPETYYSLEGLSAE